MPWNLRCFFSQRTVCQKPRHKNRPFCWWIKSGGNWISGTLCLVFLPRSLTSRLLLSSLHYLNLFQEYKFIRWINDRKLADLLYSGIYRERSQTADSGLILNKRLNKELKLYLRERTTHTWCFLSHGTNPDVFLLALISTVPVPLCRSALFPGSRIIYHQHTKTFCLHKKLLTIASPGTFLTLFFCFILHVRGGFCWHVSYLTSLRVSALKRVSHTLKRCQQLP